MLAATDTLEDVERVARGIRRRALEMAIARNGGYLGQACSGAEILAVLHTRVLGPEDTLVLSPAHYTLALWAAMIEVGALPEDALDDYGLDGARLEMIGGGGTPGMPFTTGSLAQGLSQGIGLALARRIRRAPGRVVVYMGDGELQEGQTWEAFLTLAHFRLTSVTVVLDLNDSQVDGSPRDVVGLEPIPAKLAAFGLDTIEVDGHDPAAILEALTTVGDSPRAVACRTRIWQGIPSLSSRANLHFVRFRDGEADRALADIAEAGVAS
jgi:transketolase